MHPGLPDGSAGKDSAANTGDAGLIPGSGRSPGGENGTHFNILAWRIPWTEKPARLYSPWGCKESGTTKHGHDQSLDAGYLGKKTYYWVKWQSKADWNSRRATQLRTWVAHSPHSWGNGCYAQSVSHVQLFCNPMDCSPPGSSVHGIFQETVAAWQPTTASTRGINPTALGGPSTGSASMPWDPVCKWEPSSERYYIDPNQIAGDEIAGWHHQLDGHEFEQALGVGDGQGSLACCSHGVAESDTTEGLNWTEPDST